MERRKLSPFISVSPQISVEDVGVAASLGFKTIVCNRPDNESDDQINADKIKQAAERNGLTFKHLPVVSGNITDDDVSAFAKLMADIKGPVLAYCRTTTKPPIAMSMPLKQPLQKRSKTTFMSVAEKPKKSL